MTHPGPPQAHVIVPMHRQIKVGTLHDILQTVGEQRSLSLQEFVGLL